MSVHTPRLVSVASVVITLPLHVPAFPERGSAVTASASATSVSGAFEVMNTAASLGVAVVNLCPLGTGPNSMIAREQLAAAHIDSQAAEMVGDIGLTMTLVEDGGYYTSIISPGIEADLERAALDAVDVRAGDYVYVSAGDLVNAPYRRAVVSWLSSLDPGVRVVMAASSLAGLLEDTWVRDVLPYVDVFTASEREMRLLGGADVEASARGFLALMKREGVVVVRHGSNGARLYEVGREEHVASLGMPVVDTLGVGATHIGALIAYLMRGQKPAQAVLMANVAGAVAVSHAGGARRLSADELERLAKTLD